MPKNRGKTVSFDTMVKFFMKSYNIPTKKDVDKLMARMDRLEQALKTAIETSNARKGAGGTGRRSFSGAATATDNVLELIKTYKNGVGFAEIQSKTGYEEKKLRNIIYRLNSLEKIRTKSRGVYTAV